MAGLYRSKALFHEQRRQLSLKEKVRIVLELQRVCLPLVARRRRLAPWERPWLVDP